MDDRGEWHNLPKEELEKLKASVSTDKEKELERLRETAKSLRNEQIGEPYSALKYIMTLQKGEIVIIKGEKFRVKKIAKKDIVLRSIRTERRI